jgi:Rieske Fe-S protein
MQRRDFLKGACRICLLGTAVAAAGNSLYGCSPSVGNALLKPTITDNKIAVPLSIFEKGNLQIITPEKYPYEIALEKKQDGTYTALLLKCTHYDNPLTPTGNSYTCNVHGSKFSKAGDVQKGPAEHSLQQLPTTVSSTNLSILLN